MNFCSDKRKVVLVGTGLVGMSYAYALLNQNICNELVLIDIDRNRAIGEAMDLNHGLAFSQSNMTIYAGDYNDCIDADIVAICAGVSQKQGETRINLLQRNVAIFADIIDKVINSGFAGIFLIATNPVDILTKVTQELSGFPPNRVMGTGTTLDTARLRYLLGKYFTIDPRNVHAYVIGEHGDSEIVPWSQAMVATKSVLKILEDNVGKYYYEDLERIGNEVRNAAYKIIEMKKSTYYGIGMAMTRITKAIFDDENSVLTVSAMLEGEYGEEDVYIGSPCIINRDGIQSKLRLTLTDSEHESFRASCEFLRDTFVQLDLEGVIKKP